MSNLHSDIRHGGPGSFACAIERLAVITTHRQMRVACSVSLRARFAGFVYETSAEHLCAISCTFSKRTDTS